MKYNRDMKVRVVHVCAYYNKGHHVPEQSRSYYITIKILGVLFKLGLNYKGLFKIEGGELI